MRRAKSKITLLLGSILFALCACNPTTTSGNNTGSSVPSTGSGGGGGGTTPPPSGPTKVAVAAHTLRDTNPPININLKGEIVSEDTWNSFRYAPESKFNGNYNYTYRAYSGGVETIEAFTKNGYYTRSSAGELYHERKSGNTFYQYISTKEGYLRQETTLDLQSKYTYRIKQEIYTHMFDFKDYEYYEDEGTYYYRTFDFGCSARFQGGYLTYLQYAIGMNFFEIKATFETTIDIPASYYYK